MASEQHVIVVVVEGEDSPWDITSDFLTDLRARGNYDIVATSISPVSGVRNGVAKCGDNDNYEPTTTSTHDDHYIPTYAEILGRVDGHDPSVYAGISVGKHVR